MNEPSATADAERHSGPPADARVINFQGQQGGDDGPNEVVGIFDNYAGLCSAAHDLYHSGFKHWDVMRDARQDGTRAGLPASVIADDPGAKRTSHVEVEFLHETAGYVIGTFGVLPGIAAAWGAASAGDSMTRTLMVVLIIGGGGAILGVIVSAMMAHFNKTSLAERAAARGLILWARAKSVDQETAALKVMKQYYAHHIHVRPAYGD